MYILEAVKYKFSYGQTVLYIQVVINVVSLMLNSMQNSYQRDLTIMVSITLLPLRRNFGQRGYIKIYLGIRMRIIKCS